MTTITHSYYSRSAAVRRPVADYRAAAPHLRPVPPVRALPVATESAATKMRAIFTARNITIVLLSFVMIFVGRLLVSVATDANAYAISAKAIESQNLTRDAQFIQEQLNVLNSPQYLSTLAQKMGMISNSQPAYLRISDGKVWGNPQVAVFGTIDRTNIANALEDAILTAGVGTGVAAAEKTSNGAESAEKPVAVTTPVVTNSPTTTSTSIPAPNTH